MKGNVVTAAAVFGAAMLLSCTLLVFGFRWVANGAAAPLDESIQAHGRAVERAGGQAGAPIDAGLKDLATAFDRHGQAVEHAGDKISHPQIPVDYRIKIQDPLAVQQPLTIRGTSTDGALPVNAKLGK